MTQRQSQDPSAFSPMAVDVRVTKPCPTDSMIAEQEVVPCLPPRTEKMDILNERPSDSDGARKVARRAARNLGSASISVAVGLLPIYFLAFAIIAYKNNNVVLTGSTQAEWLLQAAKYGPSVFPVVFTAIVGQLMTIVATWQLERQVTIGLLEHLLASRSLGSAFLSMAKLRIMHLWTPVILAIWCLSPLGGQAALRAVSIDVEYYNSNTNIYSLEIEKTGLVATWTDVWWINAWDYLGASVSAAFTAALTSSSSSKSSAQDMYGNLHIPMLEHLDTEPDTMGWYQSNEFAPHVALLGVPFRGVPLDSSNSSFTLRSSYFYSDCAVQRHTLYNVSRWNTYDTIDGLVLPGSHYNATAVTYAPVDQEVPGLRLRDLTANHMYNDTVPRVIGLQSRTLLNTSDDRQIFTEAWCNLTTTYVEAQVDCYYGASNCTVTSVRRALEQPWPSVITALDGISSYNISSLQKGAYTISLLASNEFFTRFCMAVTTSGSSRYTALEQYFLTPETPFVLGNPEIPIGVIEDRLFSQRFSQLLNTFWLANIAPFAITGNFSGPVEGPHTLESFNDTLEANADPYYAISNMTARVQTSRNVIRCNTFWLMTLSILSLLLIAASFATAIFDINRRAPMLLDTFVGLLRHNPYVQLAQQSAFEDGTDEARRHRNVKVQLGDVKSEEEIGCVAIAIPGNGRRVARLRRKRLYV